MRSVNGFFYHPEIANHLDPDKDSGHNLFCGKNKA